MQGGFPLRTLCQTQANAGGPLPQLPKHLYFKVLRAMPTARPRCQRCAVTILNKLRLMPKGRNTGLYTSALGFKELIGRGSVGPAGACMLLVEASKANGYLAKDGEEAVRLTIMSAIGPERMARRSCPAQSIHCTRKASVTYGTASNKQVHRERRSCPQQKCAGSSIKLRSKASPSSRMGQKAIRLGEDDFHRASGGSASRH